MELDSEDNSLHLVHVLRLHHDHDSHRTVLEKRMHSRPDGARRAYIYSPCFVLQPHTKTTDEIDAL